jgi:hypothetical protein
VRGDGGSSERVSLRHHDPHLALEHFRPGAAHFGTSFLSSGGCRIDLAETVNGSKWTGSDRHIDRFIENAFATERRVRDKQTN